MVSCEVYDCTWFNGGHCFKDDITINKEKVCVDFEKGKPKVTDKEIEDGMVDFYKNNPNTHPKNYEYYDLVTPPIMSKVIRRMKENKYKL